MIAALEELCRQATDLSEADIAQLAAVAAQLPLMAELTGSDIFLDCLTRDQTAALVVAHAQPHSGASLYKAPVTRMPATADNEPAVFRSLTSGLPMRDLKAITQEDRTVKQDVAPIVNPQGRTIAVLIREKDVSLNIIRERKLEQLDQMAEPGGVAYYLAPADPRLVSLREVNHRVKNSLQLVASILRLQARGAESAAARRVLAENAQRVTAIAATCDLIAAGQDVDHIDLRELLSRLVADAQALIAGYRELSVSIVGDSLSISGDIAASVALVVNELLTNAIQHGLQGQAGDSIRISILPGQLFTTISVEDNGCGFDVEQMDAERLGVRLAFLTVRDKLHGELHITSSESGTKASFDFRMKNNP